MARDKDTTLPPFASREDYDAALEAEFSRHSDALMMLARKYAESRRGKRDPYFWMNRTSAKFDMEERKHEAALAKLEAREPRSVA